MDTDSKYNSRKFWLVLLLLTMATVGMFFKVFTVDQFTAYTISMYGIYAAANVLQDGVNKFQNTVNKTTT